MTLIELRTDRLLLRPWRPTDAAALQPVLEASSAHLAGWVPSHVISPAPLAALATRLASFAADIEAGRSWRFGIFPPDQSEVFGEVSLFFRNADGRVERTGADRLEIGYGLRHDVTGRGHATEAARALPSLAGGMEGRQRVEIRCDGRNAPSAPVPARLGCRLLEDAPSARGRVWALTLGKVDGCHSPPDRPPPPAAGEAARTGAPGDPYRNNSAASRRSWP